MKKMRIMVLTLTVLALMAGLLPGIAGPGTAYAEEVSVPYVDAKKDTPANSPVACTPVTASVTTWGADGQTTWYAVPT